MIKANGWPMVPLRELLTRNENTVSLRPDRQYQEVTIRLWGRGVIPRGVVNGADIAADRRVEVSAGQFIISRIDARNGAMGIIPPELDGAIVTNDFPSFNVNRNRMIPEYLGWLCRTFGFVEMCRTASEGTTNRVRLKEDRLMQMRIPLPPLEEQRRIVARIDHLAAKIEEARHYRYQIDHETKALLRSRFSQVIAGAPRRSMGEVAPLVRRPADICDGGEYPELGIRSFGRGTFHKPALDYLEIGSKKLYRIEPGDLVFNNVFAWEGAIAVAQPEDAGRFGSHRFITCVPKEGVATADFLCFYFLTPEGLERIGEASPGGAGRNRTLGLNKLAKIEVPLPAYDQQVAFGRLMQKVRAMQLAREPAGTELDSLLPSILDRAFRGAL